MKTICLNFQIHQPFRYRKYRFFDIGNDSYYYDDYANETIMRKIADNCYLPANHILLKQIKKSKGKFKVSFSISGVALDQFKLYAPEVIDSFKELAATGAVEFLSGTFANSLVSMVDEQLFAKQVKMHDDLIEELFLQRPKVFRNSELIYSDELGDLIYRMGFETILTEGAKHILGWKSPNFLYCNALNPRQKVLMRNHRLSDDLSFRFSNSSWSEYPLTASKMTTWLVDLPKQEEIVNIFLNYETFGEIQKKNSGIFDFLDSLPEMILKTKELTFSTPSEAVKMLQPVSSVHVLHPISWADEERDLSAWLGNELQKEAFNHLYALKERVKQCTDPQITKDWIYLQSNDHLYYMCTKFFSDGEVHKFFNPFGSPYEAFINYMNVLSDFTLRLNKLVPLSEYEVELTKLKLSIEEKSRKLEEAELVIKKLSKPAPKAAKTKAKAATKVESKPKPPRKSAAK
ncbi:MAG: glycoside hydrolase family 57 protein [Prolixibacteraceae bacterium]|jgi:alpha-amylase|nr:glycoside hydrolase family 57 protein [Prolixibacteraceae bacterium]